MLTRAHGRCGHRPCESAADPVGFSVLRPPTRSLIEDAQCLGSRPPSPNRGPCRVDTADLDRGFAICTNVPNVIHNTHGERGATGSRVLPGSLRLRTCAGLAAGFGPGIEEDHWRGHQDRPVRLAVGDAARSRPRRRFMMGSAQQPGQHDGAHPLHGLPRQDDSAAWVHQEDARHTPDGTGSRQEARGEGIEID